MEDRRKLLKCGVDNSYSGVVDFYHWHNFVIDFKLHRHSTVAIALRIRAARIPVTWTIRDHKIMEMVDIDGRVIQKGGTERVLWPRLEQPKWGGNLDIREIENPLDLRNHLFHLFNTDWSEAGVLAFLHRVGA